MPLVISNCPLCAGALVFARLVYQPGTGKSGGGWALGQYNEARPSAKSTSEVYAKTCTQCGYVLFFLEHPERLIRR